MNIKNGLLYPQNYQSRITSNSCTHLFCKYKKSHILTQASQYYLAANYPCVAIGGANPTLTPTH